MKYLIIIFLMLFCYSAGKRDKQNTIKERAKKIEKVCYTNQDIELIIFGEKQE